MAISYTFRHVDRDTLYLLPPSLNDWLPEAVWPASSSRLWSSLTSLRSRRHMPAVGPRRIIRRCCWRCCSTGATGIFFSRTLERGTYDSVAFRYLAANDHPDHDTIAAFRKRFLAELKPLFVQILLIAQQMAVLQQGTVSLDGTKINASPHRALS